MIYPLNVPCRFTPTGDSYKILSKISKFLIFTQKVDIFILITSEFDKIYWKTSILVTFLC